MARRLRGLGRLLLTVVQVLRGLCLAGFCFPRWDEARRHLAIQQWAGRVLRALGVQCQVWGQPRVGAGLVVANHVSWLDILVIHATCPQARFVSKADVGRWPVLGWLVAAAGTLFIERERKRDAVRVVHHVAEALRAGDVVAVFPEGTTADGHEVLPFHANLLQAAIATGVPIQPVAIQYADLHHDVSPAAAYVGDTTLLASLWAIASAEGLLASARWLPAQAVDHADRRRLAQELRTAVVQALQDGR